MLTGYRMLRIKLDVALDFDGTGIVLSAVS